MARKHNTIPAEAPPQVSTGNKPKVHNIKPDPRIWKLALKLAGSEIMRIEVRSSTCVVVHNNDWRRK